MLLNEVATYLLNVLRKTSNRVLNAILFWGTVIPVMLMFANYSNSNDYLDAFDYAGKAIEPVLFVAINYALYSLRLHFMILGNIVAQLASPYGKMFKDIMKERDNELESEGEERTVDALSSILCTVVISLILYGTLVAGYTVAKHDEKIETLSIRMDAANREIRELKMKLRQLENKETTGRKQ